MPDHEASTGSFDVVILLLAAGAIAGYIWAVGAGRGIQWPRHRILLWAVGVVITASALTGPLASTAHHSFPAHMVTHLLIGMLAPLLLVSAAPVTVLLRLVPVRAGRGVTGTLRSLPVRVLTDPVVAAALNVGSLWALYTTDAYALMRTSPVLHVVVHLHMLLVGYLFTVAMVPVDPMPHRRSYRYRAAVLVVALAVHDILAKYLYAHPPAGTDPASAQTAAMVMYYGGDAIDVVLLVLLGAGWYRATRPGRSRDSALASQPVALRRQSGDTRTRATPNLEH